ncbi:unnamed protein product [Closterium sp. Yama58-4]|nr:unnamed protein product [Closterium sp. Yama58-4]
MTRGNPKGLVPPSMMHLQTRQMPSRACKDNHKYVSSNGPHAGVADYATKPAPSDRRPTGPRKPEARRSSKDVSKTATPGTGGKSSAPQSTAKTSQSTPVDSSPGGSSQGVGDRHPPVVTTVASNTDAAVAADEVDAAEAGGSWMELAMTQATGKPYATEAVSFREEGRQYLEVKDELQIKLDEQETIIDELRKELESRDADVKDALALLKHLAHKVVDDELVKVDWRVRFKFRHPSATKAQLDRSGDPGALARQARVMQRWINCREVTRKDGCIGIGKVCIIGWKEIPEDELEADEFGDFGLDELTGNIDSEEREYDEEEEQPVLWRRE